MIAGLVAAVVLIANIVSFGALMFPGELRAGVPTAIWAMLIGSCICGVWIARGSSLSPIATGIDSPTGVVLVLLGSLAGARVLNGGGGADAAVTTVMLLFSVATVITGALLYILGTCRFGAYFRFVPYFVIGGFLAATGWFLITGGVRMALGRAPSFSSIATWSMMDAAKFGSAIAVLGVLLALRQWIKSPFAMPTALVVLWLTAMLALARLQLSGPQHGWYLPSLGRLTPWSPWAAAHWLQPDWPTLVRLLPELFAVSIVALISLVTKVSSLEVSRQASGDLDRELRDHGLASLMAAPFGGILTSLQIGSSRLLEQAGGSTRMSGVVAALLLGAVGLMNIDLPGLVPVAVGAGLVFYLGYSFIVDAFWRSYAQRAWLEILLALGIMIVCIQFGYLVGVLVGVVFACVLFAISYARIGVVRRHATRAQFAGNLERSQPASKYLRQRGDAIQLYWLSGYIFFGSSEGLFERIRAEIEAKPPGSVVYVIIDFSMVTGIDSSAVLSLIKLRRFCEQQHLTLVYCAIAPADRAALERNGFFGGKSAHQAFDNVNVGLAWCENRLLTERKLNTNMGLEGFESWLQSQLGDRVQATDLLAYFDRRDAGGLEILYRQGEPADTFDLVAAGNLAVDFESADGERIRVRRILTHTVVGEMGFFRQSTRSATVSSDGPVTLFTLTRANFERMRREAPHLASAFDDFIMRTLADRIDFANHTVAALSR